jgi:Nif-specific regulatory protein
MLMSYHWPGNVRELENSIERAILVCDGGVIHAHHLPPTLQTAEVTGTLPRQSLKAAVDAFEKDMILDALKSSRGNIAKTARLLVSTERIVGYKVRKHNIDPTRYKG